MDKTLQLFKLDRDFSEHQLKKAYKNLVKACHPDRFIYNPALKEQAEEKLKRINHAYEILREHLSQRTLDSFHQWVKQVPVYQPLFNRPNSRSAPPYSEAGKVVRDSEEANVSKVQFIRRLCYLLFTLSAISIILLIGLSFSFSKNESFITISKGLDEKYGFNNLKFGMSLQQIKQTIGEVPFKQEGDQLLKSITFIGTKFNKVGGYPLDSLRCFFVKDTLYRIDLSFSQKQNEIFQFFKNMYGAPYDNNNCGRKRKKVAGKSWEGINVRATILGEYRTSEETPVWDSLVIQEIHLSSKAHNLMKESSTKLMTHDQAA